MKALFVCLLCSIIMSGVKAAVITSCDGGYSAKASGRNSMSVESSGKIVGSMKIDHAIDGGTFSLDDAYLVVFGLPKKIDVRSAQATHLSIYSLKPRIRLIKKETYGGGVYSASFSEDQVRVVVENQFGTDVIDIESNKSQSFDAVYVPPFKTQQCAYRLKLGDQVPQSANTTD